MAPVRVMARAMVPEESSLSLAAELLEAPACERLGSEARNVWAQEMTSAPLPSPSSAEILSPPSTAKPEQTLIRSLPLAPFRLDTYARSSTPSSFASCNSVSELCAEVRGTLRSVEGVGSYGSSIESW